MQEDKKLTQSDAHYKKPPWLRKKLIPHAHKEMEELLAGIGGVGTVCHEAKCPNISECFASKNATFLILGSVCTRGCSYCNVKTGTPQCVEEDEIQKVTTSVVRLGLKFVVITSPARDDLEDGGASQFYKVTKAILEKSPQTKVELLIPDFNAKEDALELVASSGACVIGHNIETVPRLYHIRKNATYIRSLHVLKKLKELGGDALKTKSALMVGLGESEEEVVAVFRDLLGVGCRFLSIGQYLAPSKACEKVIEYVTPEQFAKYKQIALEMGFAFVHATPYARSSYMAHTYLETPCV